MKCPKCGVLNCGGKGGKPGPCPAGGGDKLIQLSVRPAGAARGFIKQVTVQGISKKSATVVDLPDFSLGGNKKTRAVLLGEHTDHLGKRGNVVHIDPLGKHVTLRDRDTGDHHTLSTTDTSHRDAELKKYLSNSTQETVPMKRSDVVTFLTTNCSCWKGKAAQETLNGLTSAQLKSLYNQAKAVENLAGIVTNAKAKLGLGEDEDLIEALEAADTADNCGADVEGEEEVMPAKKKKKKGPPMVGNDGLTDEDRAYLDNMPAGIKAVWNTAVQIEKRERAALVTKIVNSLPKSAREGAQKFWSAKPIEDLLQRAAEVVPANNSRKSGDDEDEPEDDAQVLRRPVGNFFGAAGGRVEVSNDESEGEEDEPLRLPTVNYAELAYKKRPIAGDN